jgi:hypothetical protein
VGSARVVTEPHRLAPAFYAPKPGGSRRGWRGRRGRWRDWWLVLHPPYTLWHLAYVVIGACLAPDVDGARLAATVVAFFLAVGVGAHALDELHGRPLRTSISRRALIGAAAASLTGAVALGVAGVAEVGPGLVVFIVVGVVLAVVYNLELFGGALHNDTTFAAAWGSFPVLTAYYAQAETLALPAVVAAGSAFGLSRAQRQLSSRARELRRKVATLDGAVTFHDGRSQPIDVATVLAPLESALKSLAAGIVALAVAMALFRFRRG